MNRHILSVALVAILLGSCAGTLGTPCPLPTLPVLREPEPVRLPGDLPTVCTGGEVVLDADTDGVRFEECRVYVKRSGIQVTGSEFVRSRVFLEGVSDVCLAHNVIRDHPVHEQATIVIGDSRDVVLRHNHIHDNAVGVAVGGSHGIRIEDNVFESNYQHNALAIYKSSAQVSGNLFRYNHPHGVLVHFVAEQGKTAVSIHHNLFLMNVEDAINFEDWAGANDQSSICQNVISGTNWAGINVEYNSWGANILIEGNHISRSGHPIEQFPPSPPGGDGWGHGIKLEDCSGVSVMDNVIVNSRENGIDVRNCRDVTLQDNTVTGNDIGLFIGGPSPESFIRDVSPLSQENAGPSAVVREDNCIFGNGENVLNATEGTD